MNADQWKWRQICISTVSPKTASIYYKTQNLTTNNQMQELPRGISHHGGQETMHCQLVSSRNMQTSHATGRIQSHLYSPQFLCTGSHASLMRSWGPVKIYCLRIRKVGRYDIALCSIDLVSLESNTDCRKQNLLLRIMDQSRDSLWLPILKQISSPFLPNATPITETDLDTPENIFFGMHGCWFPWLYAYIESR